MRKRILRDYVLVVTAALLCGFLIFYLVVSNIMMESTRRDLEYVLQTIRSIPVENLVEQKDDLSDSLRGDDSRLTIIDEDGTVLLDSDVRGDMENHLEREEVQMALSSADGMGYAVRDSTTMNMRMMYVALYSKEQHAVYRMAIPYQGLDSYAMTLLPVAAISFAVALLIAIILSRKSARSVTRPLREIGRTIRESQKEGTTLKFRTFEYDELNEIASTIEQMENEINHYLKKLKSEKKIRQEFFDNASHELKTPLTSIRGYGELLRSGVVNDPKQAQECVDRILKETTHMTALITDILMISRLEGNDVVEKKTDIALRPAVEELCKSFTPMANEHRVMLEMQCETLCVHMSQKHVEQLIGNLISNAIKYNHEGGTVDVLIRRQENLLVMKSISSNVSTGWTKDEAARSAGPAWDCPSSNTSRAIIMARLTCFPERTSGRRSRSRCRMSSWMNHLQIKQHKEMFKQGS